MAEFHGHRFPIVQRIIWWQQYKFVLNFADIDELYNLQSDPHELENLIEDPQLAGVRHEMRHRLQEHMQDTMDIHGPQWEYILERPLQP